MCIYIYIYMFEAGGCDNVPNVWTHYQLTSVMVTEPVKEMHAG